MKQTTLTLHLESFEQTTRLAEAIAAGVQGGELLALAGELGAGKTSFTRELTRALGCSRLANSPTFALFQRYRGGRLPVLHGDFYRLDEPSELIDLGWEEMLEEFEHGLVVVEWANRFPELLPPDCLQMSWRLHGDGEQRVVEATARGARAERLLQALSEGEVL